MNEVIIVAPHFPPSNLTAGHRSRYFAAHLPKFGWKVRVISVDPIYYEERIDPELEKLLPENLEIIRTRAFSTKPIRIIGDIGIRSFWWHYSYLSNLLKREKIDLIYIPIPPNYSSMLGYLLHRRYGVLYALDYIDPWVNPWPGCEVLFSKAWFSYNLGKILEPIVLRHVSLITGVAKGYYEGALNRYKWLNPDICLPFPYGAEIDDFKYLDTNPRNAYLFDPSDGNYHFVYAGAMLPKAYTTLEVLFQSLCKLQNEKNDIYGKLRFHFVGTGSNPNDPDSFNIKPMAEKFNISDIVKEHPSRIPFLDVLSHLKKAHAVLIIGSDERHYTPSKVFQSVLSKRPVFAILHNESTAVSFFNNIKTGYVVTFNERRTVGFYINEIAETIIKIVTLPYTTDSIDWDCFQNYSTEAMALKLARAFDMAISKV